MQTDYLNLLFGSATPISFWSVVSNLLLSFALSFIYAIVYQKTFGGFSFSRTFIQSMVLGSLITCMLIMAVGDSLARGLGIMGTLTIIRFRTPVRDPRDAMFLFGCLGTGIACGANMQTVAIGGTLVFNLVALFLHVAPFASRRNYEGLLRFTLTAGNNDAKEAIDTILQQLCESYILLAMRQVVQGTASEYSYHIHLRDPSYRQDLINQLSNVDGLATPTLIMQRATVEV
jgi:uncharacterized membrane protein YhiD involved in acid resistance